MAASRLSLLAMKDGGKKSKAEKKAAKTVSPSTQYGRYSGIIGKDGKPVDNPTVAQSIGTMVDYMKTNTPESNVYNPEYSHHSINVDKKKKQKDA